LPYRPAEFLCPAKKRRENEFKKLREEEVTLIESIIHEAFEGFD
jgi:hypothetical protein